MKNDALRINICGSSIMAMEVLNWFILKQHTQMEYHGHGWMKQMGFPSFRVSPQKVALKDFPQCVLFFFPESV